MDRRRRPAVRSNCWTEITAEGEDLHFVAARGSSSHTSSSCLPPEGGNRPNSPRIARVCSVLIPRRYHGGRLACRRGKAGRAFCLSAATSEEREAALPLFQDRPRRQRHGGANVRPRSADLTGGPQRRHEGRARRPGPWAGHRRPLPVFRSGGRIPARAAQISPPTPSQGPTVAASSSLARTTAAKAAPRSSSVVARSAASTAVASRRPIGTVTRTACAAGSTPKARAASLAR